MTSAMKALPLPCWIVLFSLSGIGACGRDGLTPAPQGAGGGIVGRGGAGAASGGGGASGAAGRGGSGPTDVGRGGSDGMAVDVSPGQFPLVIRPAEVPLLPLGKTVRLRALVQIGDTWRDLNADPSVAWESTDPTIAEVAVSSGRVLGVAAGSAEVTASHPLFGAATVTVRVTAATVTTIVIIPSAVELPIGDVRRLSARANYTDGAVSEITEAATWSTMDQRIARVQNSVPPLGEVTGVLAGETTVAAAFADAANTAVVTVREAGMALLSIAPAMLAVPVGSTARFQAVLRLPSGVVTDVSTLASWSSGNATVARSVGGGQFRCSAAGTLTVSALHMAGNASASLQCANVAPTLQELRISPSGGNAPLFVATRYRLMLEAIYTDGTTTTISNNQARWTSTDMAIATIDTAATLTGAAPGVVTITAMYGGASVSEQYTFIAR